MKSTLSKAELKFLLEGKTPNPGYDRVMRYRIRQKLLKFQRDDLPALKHNGLGTQLLDATLRITENCNDITEFRNVGENENSRIMPCLPKVAPGGRFELPGPRGPHALKACALPGFATPAPEEPVGDNDKDLPVF